MTKVLLILTLALANTSSFAGDIGAGKAKSTSCVACHGSNGISNVGIYPNLKGQKKAYLKKQLISFRDGTRKDPIMNGMAKPLSDTDIENLSAYFASLK